MMIQASSPSSEQRIGRDISTDSRQVMIGVCVVESYVGLSRTTALKMMPVIQCYAILKMD